MVKTEVQDEVYKMVNEQGMTVEEVATVRGVKRETILDYLSRRVKRLESAVEEDIKPSHVKPVVLPSPELVDDGKVASVSIQDELEELEEENIRLAKAPTKQGKSLQLQMDNNRNLRKEKREGFRADAKADTFLEELVELNKIKGKELGKVEFNDYSSSTGEAVGVIQMTDLHLNEIINLVHNQYDLSIASQRLKKHVDTCLQMFELEDMSTVVIALTGDLLNSDRRLDEITNQCINRAKAVVISQHLILQAVMHVRLNYNVHVISVMGNESRIDKDWGSADNVNSNNFDYMIAANIQQVVEFSGIEGVTFGDIDKQEMIVNINGHNWLVTHDCTRYTSSQYKTQSKIGAGHLNGQPFTFIIGGHVHCTYISDSFARSASLAGTNEYAEIKLGLAGVASQNGFIVRKGAIIPFAVNVQDVEGYIGYDIEDELKKHDIKTCADLRGKEVIQTIV